ncbi:MAG: ATP-dependent sacrificial sulfur transferase LarE [Actinobacteria bacterium]|nr:ATP-dependent sacrificial sulfur transferase LarE [Actinomycetota bacterium]
MKINPDKKLSILKDMLLSYGNAAVAFSGGADSAFLLKIAADVLGAEVIAFTLDSPIFAFREKSRVVSIAKKIGVPHVMIKVSELENPDFVKNDTMRCYYCKNSGFKKIKEAALKAGFEYILDGQNIDDINDYRPGSKAAAELGVKSPLKDAGFSKKDIYMLSKRLGIFDLVYGDEPVFSDFIPSTACLATRVPYGTQITPDLLNKIEHLENLLCDAGLTHVRVRHHENTARIETSQKDFRLLTDKRLLENIISEFKKCGYLYVTLDLEGYRTGSLNRTIDKKNQAK